MRLKAAAKLHNEDEVILKKDGASARVLRVKPETGVVILEVVTQGGEYRQVTHREVK